jgi:hypothetical protein
MGGAGERDKEMQKSEKEPLAIEDFQMSVEAHNQLIQPLTSVDGLDTKVHPEEPEKGMAELDPTLVNIKIDQTTSKEFKEGNVTHLNFRLLNEMYEMLMYSGDLQFSLHVAETLYSRTKVDDEDFLSPYASYYYAQRRNMLETDLLEAFYRSYLNLQMDPFGLVRLQGTVAKIGYKFKQQVITFTPTHMDLPNWDLFVIRRGTNVPREIHSIRDNTRINEKEYVLLLTLEDDRVKAGDAEFSDLLSSDTDNDRLVLPQFYSKYITLDRIKNSPFFQKYISKGKRISRIVVGFIIDISKDYSLKLYTLPHSEESSHFNDPSLKWTMVRLPLPGHHQACFQALEQYTTKACSNPVISHLLFSPPLTSKMYVSNLCNTKANFEMHHSVRIKGQIKGLLHSLTGKLDESQLKAIEFALNHSISLFHAPSCSGKIDTLVQIVSAWLTISNSNVLVCAQSNVKADLLHLTLTNAGINSIRVMTSPDDGEQSLLTQSYLDSLNKMYDANSHFNAFYVRYPILKKIVAGASVVCTTLDALVSDYFSSCTFPRVIIDEAASTVEPLALAALTKNCQHLIMFGDHKSLGPKVVSELSACKGLRLSLFERYGL